MDDCEGGWPGLPCGGESWCQMSISLANHGHLARTLSYHWTVNVALCGEKSTSMLSEVWANNRAFLQSAIDSGVVPIRGASGRCRFFCGGDSPWLRWLSGVTTHWMAGSLFVPFVNRPFESEIHGTVNFTNFCFVLLATWRHRLRFLCHLRRNVVVRNVLKFDV